MQWLLDTFTGLILAPFLILGFLFVRLIFRDIFGPRQTIVGPSDRL